MISILLLTLFSVLSFNAVSADTIYFLYQTAPNVYPAVCTSGSMTGTSYTSNGQTGYNITSVSGNHVYYVSTTAPSIASSLVSSLPPTCEGYSATNSLPITPAGLNLQFGSTCINLYNTSTGVRASPDSVSGAVSFSYSTSPLSVSCPAPIAATASGTPCVGFTYTLGNPGTGGSVVCGAGVLTCQSYGSNEYVCNNLLQGTQFFYNASVSSYSSIPLTGQVECNSFGDGVLPLDYEGISFSGSFNTASSCISIYSAYNRTSGTYYPRVNYDFINSSFAATFTYGAAGFANSAQAACAQYIPNLSAAGASNFTCTPGTTKNSAVNHVVSSIAVIVSLVLLLVLA